MGRDALRAGGVLGGARVLARVLGAHRVDQEDGRAGAELGRRDAGVVHRPLSSAVGTERPAYLHGQVALADDAVGLHVRAGRGVVLLAETQRQYLRSDLNEFLALKFFLVQTKRTRGSSAVTSRLTGHGSARSIPATRLVYYAYEI